MIGGILYFVFAAFDMFAPLAASLAIVSVVAIRVLVMLNKWQLPELRKPGAEQ
jgi:uncharacterized membrane protein YeiH